MRGSRAQLTAESSRGQPFCVTNERQEADEPADWIAARDRLRGVSDRTAVGGG
jgi:hypothetical protein